MAKFDGILGLAFPELSRDPDVNSLIQTLKDEGVLEKSMFAFYLGDDSDGELAVGGYDASRMQGEISWVDLVYPAYWLVAIDQVSFGGVPVSTIGESAAIMDTGTSLIYGPESQVSPMAEQLGGQFVPQVGLFLIPCDATIPDLEFTVGGKAVTIAGKQLVVKDDSGKYCFFGVAIMDIGVESRVVENLAGTPSMPIPSKFRGNTWLMGDTYLRQIYTIWDYENKKFGIADLKQ
jgi:cathepsin D